MIKDATAVPLRLLYQARDELLYPDALTQPMPAYQRNAVLQ